MSKRFRHESRSWQHYDSFFTGNHLRVSVRTQRFHPVLAALVNTNYLSIVSPNFSYFLLERPAASRACTHVKSSLKVIE